ncbi:DNA (cytosine-5-)-methyltransferase [Pseudidiomarina mangrovi]|uniref:DNA (cytosine-5-)-methyltransferase n=1 Tax=Pseudidiomarina mangrovi TaxID=2487133 RepID=UPI000FCBB53A|nr:DNA (cytosine-5-)-methyltransferase [Pseudidiomarina mangrovi]
MSQQIIEKFVQLLSPLAVEHKPDCTSVSAVIDQWMHALCTDSQLYCNKQISTSAKLKSQIFGVLAQESLLFDSKSLHRMIFDEKTLSPTVSPKFRFIDLFAGIGGIRIGAQLNGGACVFSSEFDSFAQKTYAANYGEVPFGDITLIDAPNIPDHDLLLAGFPCQPFSYSGRCEGFEDKTRGTLFFDVLRILEEKTPKFALLENVKGFKSHDKGKTMSIALKALDEAGYDTYWKILNSYDFGVPQYRERWYCVAIHKSLKTREFTFPEGQGRSVKLRDIIDLNDESPSLKLTKFELDRIKFHFEHYKKTARVQHDNAMYEPHTKKGRHGVYSFLKSDGSLRFHVGDHAKTQIQEAFYACLDTYAPTIIANRVPKLWDIGRKLSVIESLRLQGFPDKFSFPVSNAQAYKQLGNSVTVNVVAAIVDKILELDG